MQTDRKELETLRVSMARIALDKIETIAGIFK
jgi:hypothetical protein